MRKLVTAWLVALASVWVIAAATGYHITGEIAVGGEGGWDYLTVDSAARRLYVSHATHVVVIDIDANKVVGDIPDTPGVHGIAIAPELNRGFISNGRGNNVTIFDLKTLKPVGKADTGENPDSIRYDAVSGRVLHSTADRRARPQSTRGPEASLPRSLCRASRNSPSPTAKARCT
jgi:DNA-binding beta-propeller fold protein YncE